MLRIVGMRLTNQIESDMLLVYAFSPLPSPVESIIQGNIVCGRFDTSSPCSLLLLAIAIA